MGLSKGTHGNTVIDPDFDEARWREWIRKEEMIRYVTVVRSCLRGRPPFYAQGLTLELLVQNFQLCFPTGFRFCHFPQFGPTNGPSRDADRFNMPRRLVPSFFACRLRILNLFKSRFIPRAYISGGYYSSAMR